MHYGTRAISSRISLELQEDVDLGTKIKYLGMTVR